MKVLMIGAGNIGGTYAEGMSKSALLSGRKIQIYDKDPKKLKAIAEKGILEPHDKLENCLPNADLVFLAVKPYHIDALFEEMSPLIDDKQMFVSLMAGVKLETILQGLNVKKAIRTMPNLPAQIEIGRAHV